MSACPDIGAPNEGTVDVRGPKVYRKGQRLGQPRPRVALWDRHSLLDQDPEGGLVWLGDRRQTSQGSRSLPLEPTTAQLC